MVDTAFSQNSSTTDAASSEPELIKTKTVVWEKPTRGVKWAYAIPYLATAALAAPLTIELKIFYTDTILVPAGLLALATAIARAFDAISDPLMGWVSDRTRTRWGRRKPWLPLGVVGSTLFFWLMFAPPGNITPQQGAIWAGFTFLFYYLFHTVSSVPYHGLGMELTPDYDDRTSVFGIRAICSGLGLILAYLALYYLKYKQVFADERDLLSVFVGVLCVLTVVLFIIPIVKIKEHPEFSTRQGVPLIPSIRAAIRNKPFQIILTITILGAAMNTLPLLLMPYFAKYILVLSPLYRVAFALVYVTATFLSLPLWMFLSRVFGKVQVIVIKSIFIILSSIVVFTLGEGQVKLMGAMEFIRGFCAGATMIIFPAMVADIIDYDELLTGKRREAQFGSFLAIIPKFISIFSATIPLAVLGFVGYNPTLPSQTPTTLFTIRALFALLPILSYILILIIVLKYPISRQVHESIRKGIDALGRGENTEDPVTGKTLVPIKAENEETTWFLDHFSVKELKHVHKHGPEKLKSSVSQKVIITGAICVASIVSTVWILKGSLTMAAEDQLKQGIGSCLIVIAGLALTLMVFHVLRISAAKKMVTNPVKPDIIENHIINL